MLSAFLFDMRERAVMLRGDIHAPPEWLLFMRPLRAQHAQTAHHPGDSLFRLLNDNA